MASRALFMAVAMVATIVAPAFAKDIAPAFAKDIVVGDDRGWNLNVDFKTRAEGKQFYVGDTLIFNYPAGKHNVVEVNGTRFQQCVAPASPAVFATGNDMIPLMTPGRKWYICSFRDHCDKGQLKLFINICPIGYAPASSLTATSP